MSDSRIGSDGREHHNKGFSFLGTLEKCPAAERSADSSKSLKQAGERGVELHAVLEDAVKAWMAQVASGGPAFPFEEVVASLVKGKPTADVKSCMKIAEEIRNFFIADPELMIGTEEKITLRRPETGEEVSFGWYDIFLKLGKRVLIVDHKFVRKEVEDAEKNRQGHALMTSVFQEYSDVEDVIVLFSMPDCESSSYHFNRFVHFAVIESELMEIIDNSERPDKTLHAGDHCVYCKHRGICPAAIGALKTVMTQIAPMAVPVSFNPESVKTPDQMALLLYWGKTLEPIIEGIKAHALKMAKAGHKIRIELPGDTIDYVLSSRRANRKLGDTIDLWEALQGWMPLKAFLSACGTSITDLEGVAVAVLTDRLLAEGKKPSAGKLGDDFCAMLAEKGLLTRDAGLIEFLKRKKVKGRDAIGDNELPESPAD